MSFDKIVSPDKIPLSWVLCGYFFLIYFSFFGYSSEWVAVLPDLDISAWCSVLESSSLPESFVSTHFVCAGP